MTPQALISLFVLTFPLVLLGGAAIYFGLRSPVGKALRDRMRRSDESERIAELEQELALLRSAFAEMQERQEFAERLLTKPPEQG